jgi:hypothetical protein
VPWRGATQTSGQKRNLINEPACDAGKPKFLNTSCRKLDGERNTLDLSANLRDQSGVVVGFAGQYR